MGTPLPPNEPGNDCLVCWGPDKTFGDGPTPKAVMVRLTRLLPGEFFDQSQEQLLLSTHLLEQVINPCSFHINDGGFTWQLDWREPRTLFTVIEIATGRPAFENIFAPLCALDIENTLQKALGTITFGGFANITWNLEGLD